MTSREKLEFECFYFFCSFRNFQNLQPKKEENNCARLCFFFHMEMLNAPNIIG